MKKKAAFLEKGRELVAEITERTGQFAHKSKLRQELRNSFPDDIWDRFHKFDGRSKNPDGSLKLKDTVAMKSKEQELDATNIEPLFPGMPLKFGFMCKTLDPPIMESLVTLYGHTGFVDCFAKKSGPIALNPIDDGLVESFKGAVEPILPSDDHEDPHTKQEWQLMKEKAEKESLQSEDLFNLARTRTTVHAHEVPYLLTQASVSGIWKKSKRLKEHQRLSALAEKKNLLRQNAKGSMSSWTLFAGG
jgi:hypothetical protein